jgi:hypothetical protein
VKHQTAAFILPSSYKTTSYRKEHGLPPLLSPLRLPARFQPREGRESVHYPSPEPEHSATIHRAPSADPQPASSAFTTPKKLPRPVQLLSPEDEIRLAQHRTVRNLGSLAISQPASISNTHSQNTPEQGLPFRERSSSVISKDSLFVGSITSSESDDNGEDRDYNISLKEKSVDLCTSRSAHTIERHFVVPTQPKELKAPSNSPASSVAGSVRQAKPHQGNSGIPLWNVSAPRPSSESEASNKHSATGQTPEKKSALGLPPPRCRPPSPDYSMIMPLITGREYKHRDECIKRPSVWQNGENGRRGGRK